MNKTASMFKNRFWIALVVLMLGSSAKCQQTDNMKSYYQIDYFSIINRVKSCPSTDFTFSVSTPSLVVDSMSNWGVTYYAFVDDSIVNAFCSNLNAKEVVPLLVDMIADDKISWQINIMLYSITQVNAIEIAVYAPNRVEAWTQERREKDIAFWKSYLSK